MDFTPLAAAAFKRDGLKSFGSCCVRDSMSYRSRLNTRTGDCICRQAVRLAGLRPPPAPAPTFRKGVNVLLTRTEEIQKVHAHVFAGLADTQKSQVFFQALFSGGSSDYVTEPRKCFDGVFGVVVVPRNPVMAEEREEFIVVPFKPLLALRGCFAPVIR
jgi:hypothetical protein